MSRRAGAVCAFALFLVSPGLAATQGADDLPKGKAAWVEARVIKIVAEQFGVDKKRILRSTELVKDLGADDLDRVELVLELEEEFDITIADDAAEKFQTVGQMIDHVTKALKARKAEARKGPSYQRGWPARPAGDTIASDRRDRVPGALA